MKIVKITKKELKEDFKPGPLEKYNDVYVDYDEFERLKGEGAKMDFMREKLIEEGNVNGIGLRNDKLERVLMRIEYKELRKDFVKMPKRLDMKADLVNQKAQGLVNQYHAQVYEGEPVPSVESLTMDTKPAYSELQEQLRLDFGTLDSIQFKRNAEIKANEYSDRYRCNVGGDIPVTMDMVTNPIEKAKELKLLEEIYRRFEQGLYLVDDMNIKDQIMQRKTFVVDEIRNLKAQLQNTDLSTIEKREVNDLIDVLIRREKPIIDFEKITNLKKKWDL